MASLPSLLCPGLGGGPGSINLTIIFDLKSKYMANILKEAVDRLPDPTQLVTKPTREVEDAWIDEGTVERCSTRSCSLAHRATSTTRATRCYVIGVHQRAYYRADFTCRVSAKCKHCDFL